MVTNARLKLRGIIQQGGRLLRHWADSHNISHVQAAIEAAWRRRRLVLIVEHSGLALAAVCSGAILMLLLGTDVLNGLWLIALASAGAAIALTRVRRQIATRYEVAQLVDRRFRLSDTLSTACFLLENRERAGPFAEEQIQHAARTAKDLDPAIAFPFVWQRRWGVAGALAAVAFGLFVVRYLVTDSLSLRSALVPIALSFPAEVLERFEKLAGEHRRQSPASASTGLAALRRADQAGREGDGERGDKTSPGAAGLAAQGDGGKSGSQSLEAREIGAGQSAQQNSERAGDASRGRQGKDAANGDANKQRAGAGSENGKQSTDAQLNAAAEHPQGLIDRMKDALSGLASKMRPSEGASNKPQEAKSRQNNGAGESPAKASSSNGKGEQNGADSQAQNGSPEQTAQAQAQAAAAEKASVAQNRSTGENASQKSADAQSGVGRQDGDKAIKEAEQLRAMGKLDEIIGKRSASLTGDISIETRSGTQQLQTKYSGRLAQHVDSGGEIDRNEIPVALQKYVQGYMEQVRREADRP